MVVELYGMDQGRILGLRELNSAEAGDLYLRFAPPPRSVVTLLFALGCPTAEDGMPPRLWARSARRLSLF